MVTDVKYEHLLNVSSPILSIISGMFMLEILVSLKHPSPK